MGPAEKRLSETQAVQEIVKRVVAYRIYEKKTGRCMSFGKTCTVRILFYFSASRSSTVRNWVS